MLNIPAIDGMSHKTIEKMALLLVLLLLLGKAQELETTSLADVINSSGLSHTTALNNLLGNCFMIYPSA